MIEGVGVFAVVRIAKGTLLFSHDEADIHWVEIDEVENFKLDEAAQAFYRDFAIRRGGQLGCPASFDLLTPGWYVNQALDGEAPNIAATRDFCFIAARDIEKGEELTLDYRALNSLTSSI